MIAGLSVKLTKELINGFYVIVEAKGGFFVATIVTVTNCLAGAGVCGGCAAIVRFCGSD